jgi:hypothetical protein
MLDGLLDDLFADSPPPRGEIRPVSPVFRPGETRAVTGFSPNSPLSPGGGEISNSPRLWWRIAIRCPDGRVIEVDAPSGMTLAEARDYANRIFGGGEVTGLVPLAGAGATAGQPADLEALAEDIASETGLSVSKALALLDADDREAIRTGSDPGQVEAWRYAARALAVPAEPIPAPGGTGFPRAVVVWTLAGRPALVWAESTEHAERLARWNPAPAATGREET